MRRIVRLVFATIIAVLLAGTALVYAMPQLTSQAQPELNSQAATLERKALPLSEPSLVESSKLDGKNWMSGLSGALYLHEINLPGTHDAAMCDPYTRGWIASTSSEYAKTQSKTLKEQLKAGVRLFDFRLTDVYPTAGGISNLEGLYLVHGPSRWFGDFRFYANQPKGVLQFKTVMSWFTEFLRDNPTETIVIDTVYESDSGGRENTIEELRSVLDDNYTINPKTGKPYVYKQNGNKAITSMPTLAETRGQIVVISSENLQRGMKYDWTPGWGPKEMGGVHFAVENHYEATAEDKVKYLRAMLGGGTVGKETFTDPVGGAAQYIPRGMDTAPLTRSIYASTGSNRAPVVTSDPHQSPKVIADYVNPRMFGGGGDLARAGRHTGWVFSDFVTDDTVKAYWKTNFPSDMRYATLTYAKPEGFDVEPVQVRYQAGSKITLPTNPYGKKAGDDMANAGLAVACWNIDGHDYSPGEVVTLSTNSTAVPRIAKSWTNFQREIDDAIQRGVETISMNSDVVGIPSDTELRIPYGRTLKIEMNGHTIDRASSKVGKSRALNVKGHLTLQGPGTVRGGCSTAEGGGILINAGADLTTNNVTIEGCRTSGDGGGVYVMTEGKYYMNGGTIRDCIAVEGGGIMLSQRGQLFMDGGTVTECNAEIGAGVSFTHMASSFEIKGNVNLTGSYVTPGVRQITYDTQVVKEGRQQNILLGYDRNLRVTGNIDPAARMGIDRQNPGAGSSNQFTYSAASRAVLANFESNAVGREIVALGNGEFGFGATYTVTFDTDGGSTAPAKQVVAINGKVTRPDDPEKGHSIFAYWYKPGTSPRQAYDFDTPVTENLTLRAAWLPAKYAVRYHIAPDNVDEQLLDYNTVVTEPPTPTREGATFREWRMRVPVIGKTDQWYMRNAVFGYHLRKDMDYYAFWDTTFQNVQFNSNGGSSVATQPVAFGSKATVPTTPTRAGYVFAGWYTDEALTTPYAFDTPVKADLTLWAKWERAVHSVTFVTNGGSDVATATVAEGSAVAAPAAPTREGCTFTGWFESNQFAGSPYDFATPVTHDLVLYAQWDVTVTFNPANGQDPFTQKVACGAAVSRPVDPGREEHVFAGWYANGASYDFSSPVDAPLTIVANWKDRPVSPVDQRVVIFDSCGGSEVEAQYVERGTTATKPAEPTRDGYTFVGWFSDAGLNHPYDFDNPVTEDLFLFAKWSGGQHIVTFKVGDGDPYLQTPVDHGAHLPAPEDPTRAGSVFAGWYKNEACTVPFAFGTAVTSDLTLYAKWVTRRFDVTFVSNGDAEVPVQSVAWHETATAPDPAPTRELCTFEGWFSDPELTTAYDFATQVEGDVTLYAKWTAAVAFTGTPDVIEPVSVTCGESVAAPDPEPTWTGHVFAGWFARPAEASSPEEVAAASELLSADPSLSSVYWIADGEVRQAYDFDEPVDNNVVLVARWKDSTHTVSFDTHGGAPAPTAQTVPDGEQAVAPTTAPEREGYTFDGWFYDEACKWPADFNEAVTEDMTLHARWVRVTNLVVFETGTSQVIDDQTVEYGGTVTRPQPDPTESGLTFVAWCSDPELEYAFDFSTPITEPMVLYAKWDEAPVVPATYSVIFADEGEDGSTQVISQSTVQEGNTVTLPPEPTRDNAVFDGWYEEMDTDFTQEELDRIEQDEGLNGYLWVVDGRLRVLYDAEASVDHDLDLYARWTFETYTVTFVDGDDEVSEVVVNKGSKVTPPEMDDTDASEFDGWYTDEDHATPFDFSEPIEEDTTIYAAREKVNHTVSFDSNGGSEVASQQVPHGEFANVPADPVRPGFTFMGWYVDLGHRMTSEDLSEIAKYESELGIDYQDLLWHTDTTTYELFSLSDREVTSDLDLVARWSEGTVDVEVVVEDGAPVVRVPNALEAARASLTDDEIAQGAHVRFVVSPLDTDALEATDDEALVAMEASLGATRAQLFDISVDKRVGSATETTAMHELGVEAKLEVDVPEGTAADGAERYLLRAHEGEATQLGSTTDDTIEGSSKLFSAYEIAVGTTDSADDASASATDAAAGSSAGAADSGSTAAKQGSANLPKTGDTLLPLGIVVGILVAAIVLVAVGVALRRRRR